MASKSATGRRRMQQAVQKSHTVPNASSRASSPVPPRLPPPRASPSPLFFQPPSRSRTPQPSPSASRTAYASSPKSRRSELRTSSPTPIIPHHARPHHTTENYLAPSHSGQYRRTLLTLSATSFPSVAPPAPPSESGPSKEPKAFIPPSPSRSGNTNFSARPAQPPSPIMKFGKRLKGAKPNGTNAESTMPSRLRVLLSREKKENPPLGNLFPPRSTRNSKDESRSHHTDHFSEERFQAKDTWVRKHEMRLHPYQSSAPYPVAFDYDALESERLTTILFRRLNPNGSLCPSFYDYGHYPPLSVLDLGCGAGHWVRDAASAWREYGTMVTGFDMVNVTKGVLVPDSENVNYSFVRGNFLTKQLPFANESFDLVRMANLSLCIPYDKWDFVLEEVHRVLTIGGRLELIDDEIIFPYTSTPKRRPISAPTINPVAPPTSLDLSSNDTKSSHQDTQNDAYIGRSSFDSISSSTTRSDLRRRRRTLAVSFEDSPRPRSLDGSLDSQDWTSHEMEAIFACTLSKHLHIHPRPCVFLLDVIKGAFGRRNATLFKTMDLALAPPDPLRASRNTQSCNDVLALSPGLILAPDTLITIHPDEIARHAYRHIDILLGCKAAMADYVGLQEEDGGGVVDDEFWDAWLEYESFAQHRFEVHPEPDTSLDGPNVATEVLVESVEDHHTIVESQYNGRSFLQLGSTPSIPSQSFSPTSLSSDDAAATPTPRGEELTHLRTIRIYHATKTSNRISPF